MPLFLIYILYFVGLVWFNKHKFGQERIWKLQTQVNKDIDLFGYTI